MHKWILNKTKKKRQLQIHQKGQKKIKEGREEKETTYASKKRPRKDLFRSGDHQFRAINKVYLVPFPRVAMKQNLQIQNKF